ncbi:Uncharacterised protein [Escherichia coli]|nr:Uncharacterised protein [Escherichia coli]VTQ43029.1 Uncharacterised protein [Streptococcus pneumoniae]
MILWSAYAEFIFFYPSTYFLLRRNISNKLFTFNDGMWRLTKLDIVSDSFQSLFSSSFGSISLCRTCSGSVIQYTSKVMTPTY